MRSTNDWLCGGEVEVVKEDAHGEAKGLVMLVDRAPVLGLAAELAPDGIAGGRMRGCGEERLERTCSRRTTRAVIVRRPWSRT